MNAAVSFPEYTCWNGEDFRYHRKPVVFKLFSEGDRLTRFDVELTADYGIWYHRDDESLIQLLTHHVPGVDWGKYVYHRDWHTHQGIDVCDPDDDELIARLEVRQYHGSVDDVEVGSNVVRMSEWRVAHGLGDPMTHELLLTEVVDE